MYSLLIQYKLHKFISQCPVCKREVANYFAKYLNIHTKVEYVNNFVKFCKRELSDGFATFRINEYCKQEVTNNFAKFCMTEYPHEGRVAEQFCKGLHD